MIKDIFIRATIVMRLETGPLGSHLNALATALQDQRYTTSTISIHLREAHAFGCWLTDGFGKAVWDLPSFWCKRGSGLRTSLARRIGGIDHASDSSCRRLGSAN